MATRKDVAKAANVSATSVSYYINKTGYVSKEKQERIQRAIEELNYRPNLLARSLKVQNTNQLLLVCDEMRNPFHSELVFHTTNEAYKNGYIMMFSTVIDDQSYIKKMCDYQVRGVIFASNRVSVEQINYVANLGIPTVALTNMDREYLSDAVTRIKIDVKYAMKKLVKLMYGKGHKHIAYLSSSSPKLKAIEGKTREFIEACHELGLKTEDMIIYNMVNARQAYIGMMKKLREDFTPRAFICTNDAVAIGTLRALYEYDLSVPEDAIVSGFDNSDNTQTSIPSLTTVDLSINKLSQLAMSTMMKKMHNDKVEDIMVSTRIIERESTNV